MDHDTEALLQNLMSTTVGRRWLLKAGLGMAAAIAATHLPLTGIPALASGLKNAPTANRTLHFVLGPAMTGASYSNLQLVANGARMPLVAHTADSRTALKSQGGVFGAANLAALTHFVPDVSLPADRAVLVSVYGTRGNSQAVVSQMWHVPEATTLAMARAAISSGNGLQSMLPSNEQLQMLGLTAAHISAPEHVAQMEAIVDTKQAAIALVHLHPQVATIDPTSAGATKSMLGQTPAVGTLGNAIAQLQRQGQSFATHVPIADADGTPTQLQMTDKTGKVTSFTSTTIQLNGDNATFKAALKSGLSGGVKAVRDTRSLGTVIDKPIDAYPKGTPINTWVQSQGVTPQPKTYAPPTPSPAVLGSDGTVDVNIANSGLLYGTYTKATGGVNSSLQVPITIYNNYVRWMWAYVQYLGTDKDGNVVNLSMDPNASWPDTRYSKSLAVVPQVFTVLGIPLWDTNTVDVTLTFPANAHTARLLYCGLGNDTYGGGWRQYFPNDAYPGRIAPTDEVLFPATVTGLMTIGLNVFALASDLAIASAWATVRDFFAAKEWQTLMPAYNAMLELVNVAKGLTSGEAAASTLIAGGATYADVGNSGGRPTDLWSILLGLGTVIPKVLFGPGTVSLWTDVAERVAGLEAVDKVTEAVPIIGEVLAVIQAVGDAVTLAEVAGETATSPWVIENEVSLTYQAQISIQRDPRAATFPVTATAWTLTPKVDGGIMPGSMTGIINPDGRIESDPLTLTRTAPFGGDKIQWTIVLHDQDGHQVGTGVSPQYVNNDVNNPPTSVQFAITELPATITADTVFKRADTTTYSDSAGGYTWSNKVVDSGAVTTSNHIQQVTGASVATTLGVVGAAWKQNDRYYLRSVPIAENGNTISFTSAPKEGYARPPFLLFDSMVDKGDVANHVLLEPDDTSDAYFIRKLTLDPQTGAISWDSNTALGMFTLPVSAAALHSSGRVVAVHTDSGRAGWLHPAITPRPGLATYFGGSGTQTGLLQSPTALAVTNPGVVLILEAGASQIAAFDLNGNPIKYFGSDPASLQFTQSLATQGTYLDMAVDGASHVYLLYYTGDGAQPTDYHIDVYNPDGSPLATHSPGVNIARLAVDFWRSIYGVNFDPLTEEGSTTVRIDPALAVAEPSISRFDPT